MDIKIEKKKKLCQLRRDKIIQHPCIWVVFAFCLIFSFLTNATIDDIAKASCWKSIVVVCNNVCYGYIAGFAFYFLSQFLPETRKEIDALTKIVCDVKQILFYMESMEEIIMEDRYEQGKNDEYKLASCLVQDPAARINFVRNGEGVFLRLDPQKLEIIHTFAERMKEHVSSLIFIHNKWLEADLHWALQLINGIINIDTSIFEKDRLIAHSQALGIDCMNYYMGKEIFKDFKESNDKYDYIGIDKES